MRISLNWLKEFVDLSGICDSEIINRITLSTAEIEEVYKMGDNLSGVVVGKILEVNEHPNSKKLHLLKVDNGKEILNIVCGAPNVREGMLTALANIGANVNGVAIQKAVVGGYDSYGMCCSGKEIGISDNNDGILDLPQDFIVGKDIKEILDIDDTIIEIDNKSLSNRPDLWGHYGFARELSAIFKRKLLPLKIENLDYCNNLPKININIDSADCLRYSCIKIGNINKKTSPLNMQIRLFYCGMRDISLLADITNYIMLEIGQPMHAFDGDKLTGINVANAFDGEKFTTLDKKERVLNSSNLMIKNQNKENICIAGVMGGFDSEVTENSNSLLLESATFSAVSIRKTANSVGLRSEASNRYEKSLDPELTTLAIQRYVYLLKKIDSDINVQTALSDNYKYHYDEIKIEITAKYIEDYCGISLTKELIKETLTLLEFKVEDLEDDKMLVTVPSFRATKDVSIKADLVEEVSRIYGYDNIKMQALNADITPAIQILEHDLEYNAKFMLASEFGLNEVSTYIWENKKMNAELKINTECHLKVVNSLNKENDELRSELVPSLLEVLVNNIGARENVGLFEIARVVKGVDANNLAIEGKNLCVLIASKNKSQKDVYFEAKKCVENIVSTYLNRALSYDVNKCKKAYLHTYNNAVISCDGEQIGFIGLMHPKVINEIDKKLNVAVVEIDFHKLALIGKLEKVGKEFTKYPITTLDFNFVINKTLSYEEIKRILNNFNVDYLEYNFKLIDIFENNEVLGDNYSYTFKYELRSENHTLKSEEIENFHSTLIEYAKKNGLNIRDF